MLLLLLSPLLLPRAAFASYAVGGPFESAQDAALSFLGYSLDDIPNGVITWFSYSTTDGGEGTDSLPNYADFAYFKSTFHHAALDATQWYTDLDGYMLADAADKARADVRAALKRYRQSGQETGGGDGSSGPTVQDNYVILQTTAGYAASPLVSPIKIKLTDYQKVQAFCERIGSTRCLVFYGPDAKGPTYTGPPVSGTLFVLRDDCEIRSYSGEDYSNGIIINGYAKRVFDGPYAAVEVQSDGVRVGTKGVVSGLDSAGFVSNTNLWYGTRPIYGYAFFDIETGGNDPTPTPDPTPMPDPDPTPSPVYGPVELPDPVMYPVTDIHITNHETGDTIYDVDFTSEVDLTPITERQETIIRVLDQIGIDLWDFEMLVDDHFNTLFWWLRLLYDSIQGLDRSTQDLVDTSIMEHTLSDILDELRDWPETGGVDVDLTALEDELEDFHIDFNSFWEELMGKLDTIIYDLEHLTVSNPRTFDPTDPPGLPLPDPGSEIVPWEDVLNITALRDALTRLMTKFPFATINDIALLFTALVRPAVAPQFDLPMPNPSDWSEPYFVHVDLSVMDIPASVLRLGITLWATARVTRRTMNLWLREEGGGDA